MKVFTFICVHAWETNTRARVNLYDMSTYKLCWSWSVSQLSTCMSLLRHGGQRNSFMSSVSVHKINAQSRITTILVTHLLHEFIVNVKHRMDWSYRKPYICLSFNFWKQYPADGICLTSVNMQKFVTSLWLLWKSPIFPDLYWNSLTW